MVSKKTCASGLVGKTLNHPTLSLKDFVCQIDNETIWHDQEAEGSDVEKVGDFHTRLGVLAEDGVCRGGGAGDSRAAMHQDFGLFRELAREIEDAFYIP